MARNWRQADYDAWLGMSTHILDVKQALLLSNVKCSVLHAELRSFISSREKVMFWQLVQDKSDLVMPKDESEGQIAAAFDSNYKGRFRSLYLDTVFPKLSIAVEARWNPPPAVGKD